MNIKDVKPGVLLHFTPEDLTVLVVMAGDDGIRYIEPMNPEYDNNGKLETTYVPYSTLSEWTVVLGSIDSIVNNLVAKKQS